jgi:opacity protein-like surface antigen
MNVRIRGLLVAAGLLVAPALVSAQANPFHVNVAAGAAIPTGDFADFTDVGYNLTLGVGMRPALSPVGFRLEGKYNSFGVKDCDDCDRATVKGLDINAIYDFMPVTKTVGVSFYGIGGIGGFDTGDDTHFGWNLGAGLRLPLSGFSGYLEARYHQVQGNGGHLGYIPITFGLSF